ncbi:MAG TPA: acyl-CoA dehydrogenase family protein [Polyangiaceae bacterium]|nr:acyl-CoA dehydrogenase family protein [Polyangiaceae bacterium]
MDLLLSTLLGPLPPRGPSSLAAAPSPADATAPTLDRAALAGFAADRLGFAFVGGYGAALARLVPSIASRACLAATERGGAHPRAILTTLGEPDAAGARLLDGEKTWVTLGTLATELLVVARLGGREGKGSLRVVRLPAARAGITLREGVATPFAPEVPHAEARFEGVVVAPEELLEGDGYDDYLKPFRTVEDLHVLGATLGYLVRVAREHAWPRPFTERALAALLALRAQSALDPRAAETHVALGGALSLVRALVDEATPHWALAPVDERDRFARDRPLLDVAGRVRAARLDAAWAGLAGG